MLRTIVHGTGGLSGGRLALGGGRVTLTAVKRMSGSSGAQKLEMLDNLWSIKSRHQKKPRNLNVISVQEAGGLQEARTQVIKVQAHHLDLGSSCNLPLSNPADIMPSSLNPFKCNTCGRVYKTQGYLNGHMKKSTKCALLREPPSTPTPPPPEPPETARVPPIPTPSHHPPAATTTVLSCNHCHKEYKTARGLSQHEARCKKSPDLAQPPTVPTAALAVGETLACRYCEKEFKTTKGLAGHEEKACKRKPLSPEEAARLNREVEARFQKALKEERRPILVAYMEVLVNTGRVEEAHRQFKLLKTNEQYRDVMEYVDLYDILLRGFARTNQMTKLQQVWQEMASAGLQPSRESFVSALMCLSSADTSKNVFRSMAQEIYNEFLQAGHTVSGALTGGAFLCRDKQQLISTLTSLLGLEAAQLEVEQRCRNPLLQQIYSRGATLLQSQVHGVLDKEQLEAGFNRQLRNELDGVVRVPSILTNVETQVTAKFQEFTAQLEDDWRARLVAVLDKKIRNSKRNRSDRQTNSTIDMFQFLQCVPTATLAEIVVRQAKTIFQSSNSFSEPCGWIQMQLGEAVMEAHFLHHKTETDSEYWGEFLASWEGYLDWYCRPSGGEASHRAAMQQLGRSYGLDRPRVKWPESVRQAVGGDLFMIMIKTITFDRDRDKNVVVGGKWLDAEGREREPVGKVVSFSPGLHKVFRPRKTYEVEETKPDPSVWALYSETKKVELEFLPESVPMLCPPLPWISHTTGAYLARNTEFIKQLSFSAESDQVARLASLPPGQLDPMLDSCNQLGSVPWKVNKPLLDLAVQIFNSDDNALKHAVDVALRPADLPAPLASEGVARMMGRGKGGVVKDQGADSPNLREELRDYRTRLQAHNQLKSETYSLWCDNLYRLSLARHFEDSTLWFPHNLDFRGRCYPLAQHINHMGSDLPRSLLVFAKGRPLGKDGFSWLKLHAINLTGLKKRESVAARLAFAEEVLEEMVDSAARPLTGRRWWLESETPWQTLSACYEVAAALQHPGGPELYVSHLPIHQDGSCNGLQHYAALGRDSLGAAAVNLVPGEVPGDVYSEIAAIVEDKRREDAATSSVARDLDGFVQRKVVKQTVMTTVYGVTRYGAGLQIKKQLKDLEDYKGDVDKGSKYLAHLTFDSLNVLFASSQLLQAWLTECAGAIAGDCGQNVAWQTPLGLPVVQPYSFTVRKVRDDIGGMDMKNMFKLMKTAVPVVRVNKLKHKNGFAPNFIHSLDSSHMMLTSVHLWSQGITFASVHDCFWTHAADVAAMNSTCRDQFVALHSSPILEDLSEYFLSQHSEVKELPGKEKEQELAVIEKEKRQMLFKELPKKGDLDLNVVKESTFFFS